MRWDVVRDADEAGVSATFPYLRGLRNGDIATSRIKQARPRLRGAAGTRIVMPEVSSDQPIRLFWAAVRRLHADVCKLYTLHPASMPDNCIWMSIWAIKQGPCRNLVSVVDL